MECMFLSQLSGPDRDFERWFSSTWPARFIHAVIRAVKAAAARIRFHRWRSASDEPSSIDGYHLAGNVRGLVRCQVDHRLRDIFRQY
jgi:hypothetical protein